MSRRQCDIAEINRRRKARGNKRGGKIRRRRRKSRRIRFRNIVNARRETGEATRFRDAIRCERRDCCAAGIFDRDERVREQRLAAFAGAA